jgi:predicted nucleic acid-binding Zn ribbon protein
VRRLAPRPLAAALEGVVGQARPAGLLAAVQSAWPEVAGPALAAAATPVSEREGTVTVACESAAWAHELDLLAPDLLAELNLRLNESLEGRRAERAGAGSEDPRVDRLRFVVGSGPKSG